MVPLRASRRSARVPTQVDYGDYRDAGGMKMPFRMIFAWMDGRDAIQLSEIQTNVCRSTPLSSCRRRKTSEGRK